MLYIAIWKKRKIRLMRGAYIKGLVVEKRFNET